MTEPDWRTLDRYLAGDATPDEDRDVHEWLAADPARADVLRHLRGAFGSADTERWDTNAAWAKLASRTERTAHRHLFAARRPQPGARRWYSGPAVRIAAALLLTVGTYATWQAVRSDARRIAMRELVTPNGQRATATLRDGSRVTLNAGSRLRYAANFGRGPRDVYLDGEAYFEVRHDAARPFRVHAHGGVAHDLGTRFTVRAYPELPRVEVAVAEGKVSLRRDLPTPSDSVVLEPGQLGRLEGAGPPAVDSSVNVAALLGWVAGTLVLNDVTLAEATPQLERWYDVEIHIADSALARRRIYARFRKESLREVLDALSIAMAFRYERMGRVVTLYPVSR